MSTGDKLRAIDDEVRGKGVPVNDPSHTEPAEGSRETVIGSGSQQGGPRSRPQPSEADEERGSER